MITTIIVIVAIICFIVWRANKSKKSLKSPASVTSIRGECEECGSNSYRFLWDRELIKTEMKQEVVQSGFSHSQGTYRGKSTPTLGALFGGAPLLRSNRVHFGDRKSSSARYRIKEVKVNVYRVSCRCNVCGHIWSKIVRDDEFNVSQRADASMGYSKEKVAQPQESSKLTKQINALLNVNPSMPANELAERLEIDITTVLEALAQMDKSSNM